MNSTPYKIYCQDNKDVYLTVTKGHFCSDHFHTNYYIDLSSNKMLQSLAEATASVMSENYMQCFRLTGDESYQARFGDLIQGANLFASVDPIDTILCMDGTEVIGAYLAHELLGAGVRNHVGNKSFYVITPEFDTSGRMVVRDNIRGMIEGRRVLIVLATAMSGNTISKCLDCIEDYGGKVEGISVIFGNVDEINGHKVNAVFTKKDLPDFHLSTPEDCPDCKSGIPADAIVNSYGFTRVAL